MDEAKWQRCEAQAAACLEPFWEMFRDRLSGMTQDERCDALYAWKCKRDALAQQFYDSKEDFGAF